ncbi:MAG: hypothetical protein P4M14_06720 [Gammaproteobacteria bacterium]|nr:hypothetical protein [Gammaproteobacteria bacterium]
MKSRKRNIDQTVAAAPAPIPAAAAAAPTIAKVAPPTAPDTEDNQADKRAKCEGKPYLPTTVFANFKQGDLLFGLFAERQKVDKKIEAKGFHHTVANELNQDVVEMVVLGTTEDKIKQLEAEQLKHYHFLSKYRDYLIRKPGKPISAAKEPLVSAAYRRACKLLLINREPDRTATAHVITNKIIWKRACRKELSQQGVTDSEMRAAYRDYQEHGSNPHVLFYDANHRQMAMTPWELEPFKPHWEHYRRSRK